jgi:hypothetical protein
VTSIGFLFKATSDANPPHCSAQQRGVYHAHPFCKHQPPGILSVRQGDGKRRDVIGKAASRGRASTALA